MESMSHKSGSQLLNHSPEVTGPEKMRWKTLSLDTWFWEMVSIGSSTPCLIALLCVLLVYD